MCNRQVAYIIIFLIVMSIQNSYGQTNACPQNHERTEQRLMEYLSSDPAIESLKSKYDIPIDKNSYKEIISFGSEEYRAECLRLNKHVDLSEKEKVLYSYYKMQKYYFVVSFPERENEDNLNVIYIYSPEYEFLGAMIDSDLF